jgi:propanol-preferring alcohol dehydrogenase
MEAMLLRRICDLSQHPEPLEPAELARPVPEAGEVLVRVSVCGVCHTELDEIEGRTPPPRLPVIPGHQIVGRVAEVGDGVEDLRQGERVGIAWIHSACGRCRHCRSGRENLCADFVATGRDVDGGYAACATVPAAFAHRLPEALDDVSVAPLLCAGAIGYRSLRLTGLEDGETLGLTGFGASGHLVLQMVRHRFPRSRVAVFARSERQRAFALGLGAHWAGGIDDVPPEPLRAVIDTTPAWRPDVAALGRLEPGGRLVINAIRKEDGDKRALLDLDYPRDLWLEKEIRSVANVTRTDVREFLALAAAMELRPEVREFPLAQANRALQELRSGHGRGALVLRIATG